MKWSMGFAALIMGLSVFLSRFMGLIRDKVISWGFGTGGEADVYFTAFVIPDFINYLLAGGYVSITLIPFLSKKFDENKADAWKFFGTITTWASILIISFTLFAFIFAAHIVPFIAPGFDPLQQARLVYFLRLILPAQIFFLIGACFSAILYTRHQFGIPALTPLVYNGFILLCGMLLPHLGIVKGMEGFCIGVSLGAFIGAFLLPCLAVYKGGFKWNLGFKHKDLWKFLILALPLMVGQSVVVLDEQFVRIFGTLAGDGAVSLLNYARRIMLVPVGLVGQAAALASFPFLASLVAQKKEEEFTKTLEKALNTSLIIIIPLTGYMLLQSESILGLIFEGGAFNKSHTIAATPLLQIMLLSVPLWTIQQIIGRAFYAKQNTITPALIGTSATLCVLPLYYWLVPQYNTISVAAITTFSMFIYTFVLCYFWIQKNPSHLFTTCIKTFLKSCFLMAPPLFFAWYITTKLQFLIQDYSFTLQYVFNICISGFIFSSIWFILTWYLAKEYIQTLFSAVFRRLKKRQ